VRLPPLLPALLCGLLAVALAPAARAMEFTAVEGTLVLSGPVDGSDLVRLRDHLAQGTPVRLVVLHDSPGGDLFNGYRLAHFIRSEGLPTAVAGKCESACGLVFLGGVKRWFSDGAALGSTMVGLHAAFHFQTGQPLPELSPRMGYVINSLTGGKFPPDLLQRTLYPRHPHDLVYAFHPLRFGAGPKRGVMECTRQQAVDFKCSMVEGMDALDIGVTTEPELLVLDEAVKAVLRRTAN
jgi:hypothetical protein